MRHCRCALPQRLVASIPVSLWLVLVVIVLRKRVYTQQMRHHSLAFRHRRYMSVCCCCCCCCLGRYRAPKYCFQLVLEIALTVGPAASGLLMFVLRQEGGDPYSQLWTAPMIVWVRRGRVHVRVPDETDDGWMSIQGTVALIQAHYFLRMFGRLYYSIGRGNPAVPFHEVYVRRLPAHSVLVHNVAFRDAPACRAGCLRVRVVIGCGRCLLTSRSSPTTRAATTWALRRTVR